MTVADAKARPFKRPVAPADYNPREVWLAAAMQLLRDYFSERGYTVPERVRVSCGFPLGRKRAIGQAWASTRSRDQHFEIFICPSLDKPYVVLSTLIHELVHVTVGLKAGHRGHFIECGKRIGLTSPWTATGEDKDLTRYLKTLAAQLGDYPHGSIDKMTTGKKKQSTRLVKAHCLGCTYTVRIAASWLMLAVPTCPNEDCVKHGEAFDIEWPAVPDE